MPINIKATLMGPLAGLGDSIIQGIIVPILLSIAMGLANGGNMLGPIFSVSYTHLTLPTNSRV